MRVNESAMLRAAVVMVSVWFAGSLASCASSEGGEMKVPLSFSGGHEIGKKDFGRPVVLIAAALEVKPEVFREAFSGVTPARGRGPSREEAQKNKAALMKVLAPHKVTNERLDEVSNYYRFRPEKMELWPTTPAKGYAVVEEGKIKSITMTSPGSGYCSPPKVTVKGVSGVEFEVTLSFNKDLKKNGGVERCVVKE
ncbi:MAG: hypothetical protein KDA68_13880 [Planctomycetaceae bacterium]|nr:hypothetical protein [Planctomycetaceae bacterium]